MFMLRFGYRTFGLTCESSTDQSAEDQSERREERHIVWLWMKTLMMDYWSKVAKALSVR